MRRLRVYIDTSVISHLDAPDTPEKQEDTRKLWDAILAGEYEAFVSPIVMGELGDCEEPKRSVLLRWLRSVNYTELQKTEEVLELAMQYLNAGVLRKKSFDDCQHIAYACVYNCDMVVSWNFKHMVNIKTISGIKAVNALAGYKEMQICPPTFLNSGGKNNDT